jgi:hypothetical protein
MRCVVHAITMRVDCRGAKALVLCAACVIAHTQEKMYVCAYYMCVQAMENVDLVSTLMCACTEDAYAMICFYEPNGFEFAYSCVTLRCL